MRQNKAASPCLVQPSLLATARGLRVAAGLLGRRLREQAPTGDMTWSQIEVLGHLKRDGPATVTRLAKAEGVRGQSMGATVAVLEAAALIHREADPVDGRKSILSLTAAGQDVIRRNRARREDWLAGIIATRLTPEEQGVLARAVGLLVRIAE